MASQASAPIHPVTVIGTPHALDLHMSMDWRVVMRVQAEAVVGGLEDPPSPFIDPPVFVRRPVLLLVWMTVDCPRTEHRIEDMVHLREDTRTGDVRVVLRPADNHGIQALDQRALVRVSRAADDVTEVAGLSLNGGRAGRDP